MHDLFNPAGLCMLEDQQGAIAYGYVAPRVFYARFVGQLSAELGVGYVRQLEAALGDGTGASVLCRHQRTPRLRFDGAREPDPLGRQPSAQARFAGDFDGSGGPPSQAVAFADSLGEPVEILCDPLAFEDALANVAPPSQRLVSDLSPVWQVWQVPATG